VPTHRLPSDPNLEQLRKQAKTLQRRLRDGDAQALALARELHPRLAAADTLDSAAVTRADAQLILARLYGFPSWNKLRRHVEFLTHYARSPHRQPVGGPIRIESDLVDEFLRLACLTYDGSIDGQDRWEHGRELLAEHPELATATIHTIAAVGDVAGARALLADEPAQARLPGGPHDWEPLLYLAYSRIDSTEPGHSTLEVARLLLEHGADPNATTSRGATRSSPPSPRYSPRPKCKASPPGCTPLSGSPTATTKPPSLPKRPAAASRSRR
jgi:hypothetical protein